MRQLIRRLLSQIKSLCSDSIKQIKVLIRSKLPWNVMQSLSGAWSSAFWAAGSVYQGTGCGSWMHRPDLRTPERPTSHQMIRGLAGICNWPEFVHWKCQWQPCSSLHGGCFFSFFSVVSLGSCSVIKWGHTDNPLNMLTVVLKIAQWA